MAHEVQVEEEVSLPFVFGCARGGRWSEAEYGDVSSILVVYLPVQLLKQVIQNLLFVVAP